jgi:hypothetical protein
MIYVAKLNMDASSVVASIWSGAWKVIRTVEQVEPVGGETCENARTSLTDEAGSSVSSCCELGKSRWWDLNPQPPLYE